MSTVFAPAFHFLVCLYYTTVFLIPVRMIGVGSWVFGFTECIIMDQGGFEDLVHRFAFLFVFFFISPDFSLRTCCVRV